VFRVQIANNLAKSSSYAWHDSCKGREGDLTLPCEPDTMRYGLSVWGVGTILAREGNLARFLQEGVCIYRTPQGNPLALLLYHIG